MDGYAVADTRLSRSGDSLTAFLYPGHGMPMITVLGVFSHHRSSRRGVTNDILRLSIRVSASSDPRCRPTLSMGVVILHDRTTIGARGCYSDGLSRLHSPIRHV